MKYASVKLGSTGVPWPVLAAALAVAPLLTVLGLHAVVQTRSAASGPPVVDVKGQFVAPSLPRPSPDSEALALTFNAECAEFGPSPMINKAPAKPPPPKDPPPGPTNTDTPPAPTAQAPSAPPRPPTLTLTSIMDAQGQPCAVINGKIRRVGDSVGKGFKIVSINGTLGQVVIGNGKVRSTLQLKRASDGE